MMARLALALLFLFASSQSYAGELFYKYGVGAFRSADYGFGETKMASIGVQGKLAGPFIWQVEVGGYFDGAGNGRLSSGFANYSMGPEVVVGGVLVIQSLWGIGGITTPDSMLGGNFQFNQDLFIGGRGPNDATIGVDYKHMSSASIYKINIGRDFLPVIRASFHLW